MTTTTAEDDVKNNGSANQRGDGIKGNDASLARENAKQVTEQGNDAAHQQGDGKQRTVVGRSYQQTGYVGYSQANK